MLYCASDLVYTRTGRKRRAAMWSSTVHWAELRWLLHVTSCHFISVAHPVMPLRHLKQMNSGVRINDEFGSSYPRKLITFLNALKEAHTTPRFRGNLNSQLPRFRGNLYGHEMNRDGQVFV